MTYGRPERIEAEYTRHGTLTLIGNFDVTTGELITPTIGPTRTELDFVEHIAHTRSKSGARGHKLGLANGLEPQAPGDRRFRRAPRQERALGKA